jgi:hypothetical protein
LKNFDVLAMYAAMDAKRVGADLSWPKVAQALWDQSAALNAQLSDHPISPATLTGMAKRGDCTCQHALFVLRWLGRSPESFISGMAADAGASLPAVGDDQRLRWDLGAVFEALNQHRQARGLTWHAAAREIRCSEHQLRGLKTARYAIGMRLMMRIVQWVGQPAATFIRPARW